MDRPESPTELIARISAEHDSPIEATGRHRLPAAVVTRDVPTRTNNPARRLAPLAIGAAVMLVATVVASVVQPAESTSAAELTSSLAQEAPPTTAPAVTTEPPVPTTGAPIPPVEPPKPAAPAPKKPPVAPPPGPAAPKPAAPAPGGSGGDGNQVAKAKGWTLVGGDEFNGGMSDKWGPYEGAGHDGNGKRVKDAIKVENGVLVIRGDANGNTGGMAWDDNQTYGKWEIRARFPKGDGQYHPVLLLWPENGWPPEIDFAETTSASDDIGFYLHYDADNKQVGAQKKIDLTQWHNYAVEWVNGRVTGFVDGEQWFESTDGKTVPNQPMHAAIQLDNFGGVKGGAEMFVDYMRIYK